MPPHPFGSQHFSTRVVPQVERVLLTQDWKQVTDDTWLGLGSGTGLGLGTGAGVRTLSGIGAGLGAEAGSGTGTGWGSGTDSGLGAAAGWGSSTGPLGFCAGAQKIGSIGQGKHVWVTGSR